MSLRQRSLHGFWQSAAGLRILVGIMVGPCALLVWAFLFPWPDLDRRQFMAECTTARGSDDAGSRACATDWPLHQALHARDWRAP